MLVSVDWNNFVLVEWTEFRITVGLKAEIETEDAKSSSAAEENLVMTKQWRRFLAEQEARSFAARLAFARSE